MMLLAVESGRNGFVARLPLCLLFGGRWGRMGRSFKFAVMSLLMLPVCAMVVGCGPAHQSALEDVTPPALVDPMDAVVGRLVERLTDDSEKVDMLLRDADKGLVARTEQFIDEAVVTVEKQAPFVEDEAV